MAFSGAKKRILPLAAAYLVFAVLGTFALTDSLHARAGQERPLSDVFFTSIDYTIDCLAGISRPRPQAPSFQFQGLFRVLSPLDVQNAAFTLSRSFLETINSTARLCAKTGPLKLQI